MNYPSHIYRFFTRRIWISLLLSIILIPVGLVIIVPYLWMFTTSLKARGTTGLPPFLFPSVFLIGNYLKAWQAAPFINYYLQYDPSCCGNYYFPSDLCQHGCLCVCLFAIPRQRYSLPIIPGNNDDTLPGNHYPFLSHNSGSGLVQYLSSSHRSPDGGCLLDFLITSSLYFHPK